MSTLATLRTATRRLIDEETSTNSHFTDAEINTYLNQATLYLGTQMEWSFQTSNATSVTDQALYELPSDFLTLTDVYFDDSRLELVERADLSAYSASWQDSPSAKPVCAYKSSASVMGLYPAPSSAYASKTIQIQYIQTPATLSSDSDVPDVHTAFQMCLPFYAAFLCESKLGNDKKAALDLSLYDQHRKVLMSKVQRFSDDLFRFRWSGVNYGR